MCCFVVVRVVVVHVAVTPILHVANHLGVCVGIPVYCCWYCCCGVVVKIYRIPVCLACSADALWQMRTCKRVFLAAITTSIFCI